MIFVKYVSVYIRTIRICPFPTELNTFYSHYEFISSAECSAGQKNVLFLSNSVLVTSVFVLRESTAPQFWNTAK